MKRILYVESEEDISDAIQYFLKKEGYSVHTARSLSTMGSYMSSFDYDLIILDSDPEDGCGFKAFREISPKTDSCFIMTGLHHLSGFELDELKKMGLCKYFVKPFEHKNFIDSVRKYVR